jgi:hypothetical protein
VIVKDVFMSRLGLLRQPSFPASRIFSNANGSTVQKMIHMRIFTKISKKIHAAELILLNSKQR